MPAFQNISFSLETVHNYFAQLNPIASKISQDIHETKLAYGNLWHRLKPNEHADIINETIIKPEISLRYFDKFNLSSSISMTSSTSSRDESANSSIIAEVNKKTYSPHIDLVQNKNNTTKNKSLKAKEIEPILKNYYGFDRNRLRTYASQKVALKIMRDEILGTYRDEHSKPFSYKTKSQINLHIFTDAPLSNDDGDQICLLSSTNALADDSIFISKDLPIDDHFRSSVTNYKKLQTELTDHIYKTTEKETFGIRSCSSSYKKVNNLCWNSPNHQKNTADNSNILQSAISNSSANTGKKELLLKSYIDTAVASPSKVLSCAVYSDDYFEQKESTNLMQSCSSSGVLTIYSSSANTSDDDHDDDEDEKTLCEDVKLLDNDICLRRGFDFLNNW